MIVGSNLININNDIKYIAELIIAHIMQVENRANQIKKELDTSTGLLRYLQEVNTIRRCKINERLTSRNLGQIRDRMQVQLAALRVQVQFQIRQAGPIINNPSDNSQDYIHSIGIDLSADSSPPTASAVTNHMTPTGLSANVPVTDVWPFYAIEENRNIWLNHASIEFTNDLLNYNIATGIAGAGVLITDEAGAGHLYVIPAHPFRRDAELLDYNNDIVVNQFLRGLNKDCIIEAERICIECNIENLRDRQIIPKQLPLVGQEPVILKLNPYPDESSNLFNEDINHNDDDRHLHKIAKRIAKARKKYDDTELNKAMRELSLDDHDNSMNTSNTIRGMPIELVQVKSAKVVKIPVIKPSTNIIKTDLINLLKLADIRKIIWEIIYKILENYESTP
ncbi:hypothetical protein RCL_jg24287.t1 [Rhizophagus clarus]|uniref:Uncharacterized protein n=1 Tax=Rhizophagus clarus TaxID=94130 RepID=A0A8H3R4P8_9GLOM|nr:hypothetical protein RCL_jg24287.t1 [Rhizophagus clarus]